MLESTLKAMRPQWRESDNEYSQSRRSVTVFMSGKGRDRTLRRGAWSLDTLSSLVSQTSMYHFCFLDTRLDRRLPTYPKRKEMLTFLLMKCLCSVSSLPHVWSKISGPEIAINITE